ncbi:MAG TPA: integrase core domain-containing protein [Candidatus Goldiibacteriota bacterium]|nr:integrase core domain-containing protein [Candidatus Goldiibacteriota bacterium]
MLENRNGIPSRRVIDVMERLIAVYGEPEMVLTDNGPEFISKVYKSWADKRGIKLCYIDPANRCKNAYMESFNDKFRDECLNENYFVTVEQAQAITDNWRREYNFERPHSSLNYMIPDDFLSKHLKLTEIKKPLNSNYEWYRKWGMVNRI